MDWSLTAPCRPRPTPSRLLALPVELRDLILEYVLSSSKPMVTFRLDDYQRDCLSESTQPPLLFVNKQIRAEGLPIFYGCNEFVIHNEEAKLKDGRAWLLRHERYFLLIKKMAFWMRYVDLLNARSSQGAIALHLARKTGLQKWNVGDSWEWITVVRKPGGLDADANFLVTKLRQLLRDEYEDGRLTADRTWSCLFELKGCYIVEKMS